LVQISFAVSHAAIGCLDRLAKKRAAMMARNYVHAEQFDRKRRS
jgi:hypothetical protein